MTTKRKTTVRKNGKTLHGAAAEAVLRAREKRAKKKRPNGVGSTISTTVRALHEAARGVMKATMDNPARKEQLFYVDTYRGRELESQGALMAASQKQAISRTKRAYREAGDDPRKYRFKAYADNPGMFSGGNARRVSARDFMRGARVRVKGSKKELTIDTPIRSGGVVVAYKLSNGALVEPRDLQVLNPTGRPTVNRPPQRSNSAERDAQHPNLVHRYYRGGGKSQQQRATEAGQKWLFENPAHLMMQTRKRRNPEGGAPELVETLFADFQGRPTEGFDLIAAPEWTPSNVAVLGGLNRLRLAGGEKVDFNPEHVVLAADKNGELLILGAQFDGAVDFPEGEGSFEVIETPAYMPEEVVLIDEIKRIEYDTHKDHIGGGEEFRFVHKFGEEGGARPFLALDPNGFPMIIGGDWYITREGIRD